MKRKQDGKLPLAIALALIAWAMPTWALGSVEPSEGGQRPLEVNGQSRNLNMTLVLRNDKDKIKFVKIRDNYREEIVGQIREADPDTHVQTTLEAAKVATKETKGD